jgi:hypothetical protein
MQITSILEHVWPSVCEKLLQHREIMGRQVWDRCRTGAFKPEPGIARDAIGISVISFEMEHALLDRRESGSLQPSTPLKAEGGQRAKSFPLE